MGADPVVKRASGSQGCRCVRTPAMVPSEWEIVRGLTSAGPSSGVPDAVGCMVACSPLLEAATPTMSPCAAGAVSLQPP